MSEWRFAVTCVGGEGTPTVSAAAWGVRVASPIQGDRIWQPSWGMVLMSFILWGWPVGGLISKRLPWNQISHASLWPSIHKLFPSIWYVSPWITSFTWQLPRQHVALSVVVGASSRCHGCGECCLPPPFPLYQLPLHPAGSSEVPGWNRHLGESPEGKKKAFLLSLSSPQTSQRACFYFSSLRGWWWWRMMVEKVMMKIMVMMMCVCSVRHMASHSHL